jgi:hypothetical protein
MLLQKPLMTDPSLKLDPPVNYIIDTDDAGVLCGARSAWHYLRRLNTLHKDIGSP